MPFEDQISVLLTGLESLYLASFQRQIRNINSLRSLSLCGENNTKDFNP